ncbi:hypothetical protein N8Z26_03760 [Burkholderiales bacterium]|nr:hypothetical protein [Burkholderiales bacterium]
MTTTPCGPPVYSYSNTWDLALSMILQEPTNSRGTTNQFFRFAVFGQEQQKLGAED